MAEKLKREFIELLEKDSEFRYIVAGFLGLSEILKRLKILEEGQEKIWEELKALRENQEKLWESQKKLWENQSRLWEGQNRLWEEVKALRLEQDRMRRYMVSGFRDLSRTLGVAFEDHAASFLEVMLEEMGYSEAKVEKKYLVYEGEVIEINMFCENPLVVGETTVNIREFEDAEREIEKLVMRIKIVEEKYHGKPILAVLSVARATPDIAEILRHLGEKHGIKIILGREIEETLSI